MIIMQIYQQPYKHSTAMKNILVAIDFSKNAEHALEYALLFAKQDGCRHKT